jgi:hypothetical protein
MGRFGSGLYHGCLNAPKSELHPLLTLQKMRGQPPCGVASAWRDSLRVEGSSYAGDSLRAEGSPCAGAGFA